MKNITDYIAKTVAFKVEFEKLEDMRLQNQNDDELEELKKKKFISLVAFHDFDDLMACRAILNIMFPKNKKVSAFIDNLIDEVNILSPRRMTEIIDCYMDTISVVMKELRKREKWYNEFAKKQGLITFSEFMKCGRAITSKGNEHSRDANIVSGNQVNPNLQGQIISSKKTKRGLSTISSLSEDELRRVREELNSKSQQIEQTKQQTAETSKARQLQMEQAELERVLSLKK